MSATAHPTDETITYTTSDRLIQDFACRGLVILAPESLGIPNSVHDQVYKKEKEAYDNKKPVTPSSIPDVLDVINSPGLVDACNQLVGENWAIVPFTHNASFTSGPRDQHWHKDDNGPYNSRKQRHHQAVQIEMLYYPQHVREDMGPTATIPYSQYWTFNHEENHDNFAGADHLDFNYHLSGMEREHISGPDAKYDRSDIVNANTAHDIRMRDAVTNLKWPLVHQLEAAPLRAGSVVIYSHNTFHRGNHRRDDWRNWPHNPRFMWRFWLYRTTEPKAPSSLIDVNWNTLGTDPLTQVDLSKVDDTVTEVWRYHTHWIQTGQAPPPRTTSQNKEQEAEQLFEQLHAKHDEAEPTRIGAAYKLAAMGDTKIAIQYLEKALYNERESVRRAATYGLIALGSDATDTFLTATQSSLKWVRKAGVYGLGDASPLTEPVFNAVDTRLKEDPSVYIRSVAAGTLGCLGRRAIGTGEGKDLVPDCVNALIQSLEREENRLSMDRVQNRSIKFVRPTDDCDVCEGNGIDFGLECFKPVRSAVRENAIWSLVILCSHGTAVLGDTLEPTIQALKTIIRTDENVISVGLAQDALNRLANLASETNDNLQQDVLHALSKAPVHAWESLVRGGLHKETLAVFYTKKQSNS